MTEVPETEKRLTNQTTFTMIREMRIGIIFGIVLVIIVGTILWKRGKPPVP